MKLLGLKIERMDPSIQKDARGQWHLLKLTR